MIFGAGEWQNSNLQSYVGGSPILATDSTGNLLSIGQLTAVGISAGLIGLTTVNFGTNVFRNTSASSLFGGVSSNAFVPVDNTQLTGMRHSIRLRGGISADAMFVKMAGFRSLNMYPVNASSDVTGLGGTVSFDMTQTAGHPGKWAMGTLRESGQGDFPVRITKYDANKRYFVARTLGGHPLAGWRRWQVRTAENGDLIVETFSVEHSYALPDRSKMAMAGKDAMGLTWKHMLLDLKMISGGEIVYGSDTMVEGSPMFSNADARALLPFVE